MKPDNFQACNQMIAPIFSANSAEKTNSNRSLTMLTDEFLISDNQPTNICLGELNEQQLEIFAQNAWLITLIEKGVPVAKALQQINSTRTERSARQLAARYKKEGYAGLIDKRWLRKPEKFVLKPEVEELALGFYFSYPAAGNRAIWSLLIKECEERQLPRPSESSITKFLNSLPEAYKMFRGGKSGVRRWEQTAAPVVRYENTTFANERWQADDSPLPIWVRVKINGEWQPAAAFITSSIDVHSRAIPGYVVSTKCPDSWTISLMLRQAILSKNNLFWRNRGIPRIWQSDRGSNYMADSIVATLKKLKTVLDPDPPNYPNSKGKKERFYRTLDAGCLSLLPGHHLDVGVTRGAALKRVHEFLTLQQLDAEIERWIVEDYHQRTHSETNRKPAELWEETVRLSMPTSEDYLDLLLLKDDILRTVRNIGIDLTLNGIRRTFWSPDLLFHFRRRVRLAYNPEDLDSVLVYCATTGERICEAFDMRGETPRYTIDDIKVTRSQFRRGLIERIKDYHAEIKLQDRRALQPAEWSEIRKNIEGENAELLPDTAMAQSAYSDAGIIELMQEFRARDREIN